LNVLRHTAGLPYDADCMASSGDVDCDGDRDAADALGILRYVARLAPPVRPADCPGVG
jgi:CubicO group peptidase (beta-lactamase class C family)